MVKSTEPAKDERRKASRNGEEVNEYLSRSDLASRMGTGVYNLMSVIKIPHVGGMSLLCPGDSLLQGYYSR